MEQPTGDPETGIVHKTADERRPTRQERIPLGILYMLIATVMFAGTSALAKWLVATYPIGEVLFVRTAAALIGSSLVILPTTGLAVFRTKRLRDHALRGISQSCAQVFLVVAFSLMPLASAVAIFEQSADGSISDQQVCTNAYEGTKAEQLSSLAGSGEPVNELTVSAGVPPSRCPRRHAAGRLIPGEVSP